MNNRFLKFINENRLLTNNSKVILAVSGGIDSMVMMDLFLNAGIKVALAHCNFQLRGDESEQDEIFVSDKAKRYSCEFFIKRMNTKEYAIKEGLSIQLSARKLRYEWFEELTQTTEFRVYATAHHFDDQIETFFINLIRGTGISGLRGIPTKSRNCIRPLLFAYRSQIEAYANTKRITYREDSSNFKDDYLRNRIRHFVIPALEGSDQKFRTGIKKTFKILSDTKSFLTHEIEVRRTSYMSHGVAYSKISKQKISTEANPKFVLFELLKPFHFNFSTVEDILCSMDGTSGKTFCSQTHELVVDREFLIISEIHQKTEEEYYVDSDISEIFKPIHLRFKTKPLPETIIFPGKNAAFLDFDKLQFPLEIRKYRSGDYFYPLGMKGKKKLSDFFIDNKISIPEKKNTWLLVSIGEIAWVIGHRIDERFKITKSTEKIFFAELI